MVLATYKVKNIAAALLSMAFGSQCVHMYYKPMSHFSDLVDKEKARLRLVIAEKKQRH